MILSLYGEIGRHARLKTSSVKGPGSSPGISRFCSRNKLLNSGNFLLPQMRQGT